ncbi:hypothetical protein [Deinococcus sp.]|uniref:hypothetical protein n=1 Tax=Deinococcus sp. TaxID=47478 RepID=UPI003CC6AB7E
MLERGSRVLTGQRAHPAWAAGQGESAGGSVAAGERAQATLNREWQGALGVEVNVGTEVYRRELHSNRPLAAALLAKLSAG